ncbi:MAG TPA: hypothetical protein VE961_20290 [Pyrinomonadaceae bacterium]|nr:hypothetical protein [Pyrinomonadaceae bacterium]
MKPLVLFISLGFSVCGLVAHASAFQDAPAYKTYANARFSYSIAYPADLLAPQGEAENGDGQVFSAKDGSAEMRVYGRYNVNNEKLSGAYADLVREWGKGVNYKVMKGNWFAVSAVTNGKIKYQKTMLRGDVFKTFQIEYDATQRATYDAVTARVSQSFKG